MSRLRVIESRTVFRGRLVHVKVDRVREPNGVTAVREVVCHRGSVVVVPHLNDGRVVLVRQYRHAPRRWLWELVAGGIEPGETPLQAARRELREETGYRARSFTHRLVFYASPGFLTERMVLVEACGLSRSRARPEADEQLEVGRFTPDQLRKMIKRNTIQDAKTLVGLLWLVCEG